MASRMRSAEVIIVIYIWCTCLSAGVKQTSKNSLFANFKSVSCKHNPKFLGNVSCFAKSYSRTLSTITIMAAIKKRITSVTVSVTVSRHLNFFLMLITLTAWTLDAVQVWHDLSRNYSDSKKVWRLFLEIMKQSPFANELFNILEASMPGLIRPCPWKVIAEIEASKITLNVFSRKLE